MISKPYKIISGATIAPLINMRKKLLNFTAILVRHLLLLACMTTRTWAYSNLQPNLKTNSIPNSSISRPPPGYVSDVNIEKNEKFTEVFLSAQTPPAEPTLQNKIFSPLSKEFKQKYFDKFGQLDTASIPLHRTNFDVFDQNTKPVNEAEKENKQRNDFADYMTKRLLEYHVDQYMKNEPKMRPVLEVKEKIQNVKVEVSKEVRLDIQYNFAGNAADLNIINPWCDTRFSLQMNPHAFGPTDAEESRMWLGKNLTKTVRLNANAAFQDGIAYTDISKNFESWNLGSFLGVSSYFRNEGPSVRESKLLAGFSKAF